MNERKMRFLGDDIKVSSIYIFLGILLIISIISITMIVLESNKPGEFPTPGSFCNTEKGCDPLCLFDCERHDKYMEEMEKLRK